MFKKQYLSFVSSIFLVTSYLLFTFLSLMNFPTSYSPMSHWLSDLGNTYLNPRGALFYNIGIILTGIAMISFFLGLSSWAMANNKKQKVMLFLTQLFGFLGSLSVVMSAVFPINIKEVHSFLSSSLHLDRHSFWFFSCSAQILFQISKMVIIFGSTGGCRRYVLGDYTEHIHHGVGDRCIIPLLYFTSRR